ncbi:MAG: N-acetylmuramoyl-L-alanine amidase-like domain-containing protein [Alphaproteobacteria bacterium]
MINKLKTTIHIVISLLLITLSGNAFAEEPIISKVKAPRAPKIEYKQLAEIRKLVTKTQKDGFDEKILKISDFFLGKPYNFELGERLITWDKHRNKLKLLDISSFDCLSYVETVLALAKFDSVPVSNKEFSKGLSENLSSIMFAVNDFSYTGRNHFIDSEWIKSNSNFIVGNIAEELPYAKTKTVKLDKKALLENQLQNYATKYVKEENKTKFLNKFKNELEKFTPVDSTVKYISFNDFLSHKNELIEKLKGKIYIFALVMNNPKLIEITKSDHNIGHVGFIYVKDNNIHLKHASASGDKLVEDILLVDYAKAKEENEAFLGFSLYEIK